MKIRYVVADDAPFIREIIKNLLSSDGHICVGEASNGDEVLDLVRRTLPDLVITDIVMPQKNGLHAIKNVRDHFPTTKIIGCSTLDQPDQVQKAYAVGCDAYVIKPFSAVVFKNTLLDLFSSSEVTHD